MTTVSYESDLLFLSQMMPLDQNKALFSAVYLIPNMKILGQ